MGNILDGNTRLTSVFSKTDPTFSKTVVHQFVAKAIPSKPRAVNDGVKSKSRRTQ